MRWQQLESHLPSVYRFALRLTSDPNAAEDLTQDALIRAWEKRSQLKEPEKLRVWLLQIASNLWRDQLRRRERQPLHSEDYGALPSREPSPEGLALRREKLEAITRLMERLPQRQREVMHLFAVESLSLNEIAEVLEISRNAAKVNLFEARKKMRSAFAEAKGETEEETQTTTLRES